MIVVKSQKKSKKNQKIHAWLRERLSGIDYGCKYKGHPIHCNTNEEVLSKFNNGGWLSRLTNAMMDRHFIGHSTLYFTGNGSSKSDESLAMLDIDCHGGGSPEGAMSFAEHLRTKPIFGENLYVESSTHGAGAHGFFIVRKGWSKDRDVNAALKVLEQYFKGLAILGDFHITDAEVKGMCPELTWGEEKGHLTAYKSGTLAKLPRETLSRGEELRNTTRVTVEQLLELGFALADEAEAHGAPGDMVTAIRSSYTECLVRRFGSGSSDVPKHWSVDLVKLGQAVNRLRSWAESRNTGPVTIPIGITVVDKPESVAAIQVAPAKKKRSVGSTEVPFDERLAAQIKGRLLRFAKNWLPEGSRIGNRLVHAEDIATLIAILAHTKDHPNKDGSTPTAWIKCLWEYLKEEGYTKRPWEHHRYKAARDFLSRQGWLVWNDPNYVIGREVGGVIQKGQAAKWDATEYLRSIAKVEEVVVEGEGSLEEERREEEHIYGHNTLRLSPETLEYDYSDCFPPWKSPLFGGFVGQSRRLAA